MFLWINFSQDPFYCWVSRDIFPSLPWLFCTLLLLPCLFPPPSLLLSTSAGSSSHFITALGDRQVGKSMKPLHWWFLLCLPEPSWRTKCWWARYSLISLSFVILRDPNQPVLSVHQLVPFCPGSESSPRAGFVLGTQEGNKSWGWSSVMFCWHWIAGKCSVGAFPFYCSPVDLQVLL